MMNSEVYCNKCKKDFNISLKEEVLDTKDHVVRTYFVCPHCGEQYEVSIIDSRIRGMAIQLQELQRKITRREANLTRKYLS